MALPRACPCADVIVAMQTPVTSPDPLFLPPLGTVAILGLGLMGGSLGMALRARGAAREVVGWARRPATLEEALARGAIDRAAADLREAVAGADVVVLAVTVGAILPLLAQAAPACKPDAAMTDVGSAKARIVREAEPIAGGRFVGGHPMAGSEQAGIAAASADLYQNAVWALTPTPQTDPEAIEQIERMARWVGAKPLRCDPGQHDRLVAILSHLPHLLAYGLAQTAGNHVEEAWADLAAGSFRDGTRVAKSDPALWTEILLDNREAVLATMDYFDGWFDRIRAALRDGDAAGLAELLSNAHNARKRFPR